MERREFIKLSMATSVVLLAGGCGDTDESRAITVREGTPNSTSTLESLYRFEGNPSKYKYTKASFEGSKVIEAPLSNGTKKLRIFHLNDMHNHMVDPHASKGDTNRLAQMAKIYREAHASAASDEIVLFVSAGDDHTGNVLDELRGWDEESFRIDSAYHMYSKLGLCAAAIGNHELDKGAALLARSITNDSDMVMLSANLSGSRYLDYTHVVPAAVCVAKGVRIGMIGLTTHTETKQKTEEDPDRIVTHPLDALENILPVVAKYSDVVLLLSHVGFGGDTGQIRHDSETADIDMAQRIAEICDKPVIIIGGHTHSVLHASGIDANNIVNGILIAQAGANGKYLGEIEANLRITANASTLELGNAKLYTIKTREERAGKHDPLVHETDADIDMDFKINVTDPIMAMLSVKLAERLASVVYDQAISTEQTIADRYVGECAIANFMNDAVVARSHLFPGSEGKMIDFAVFNASGLSAGVPEASELTFQDWYGVMPYADSIQLAQMSGAQIKAMVRSNAQRVLLPDDRTSEGQPFDTAGFISWGFLHFSSALRYEIKGSSRNDIDAINITLHGKPIDEQLNQIFTVSFSNYIGGGFEYWNGTKIGAAHPSGPTGYDLTQIEMHDTYLVYRNEIIAFIRDKGVVGASSGAAKDGRLKVSY
ncbi:MAG: bifunctional metallophosphatase/5'-nucleotidase [Campylobacterales bacterium]|nr:bifunctional metallophosphatase/5'-nucleotidase [Campylobacterales bacterium]